MNLLSKIFANKVALFITEYSDARRNGRSH